MPQPVRDLPANPHWQAIASQWNRVGSPLRPNFEDCALFMDAIRQWPGKNPRALILGVTPELYNLPWPAGTTLQAADHTEAMIDAIWPGPRDAVICAEWATLPLPAASRDIVLCDGGLHLVPAASQPVFVQTLARITAPGGIAVFRLFLPPEQRESPQAVLADLMNGQIPDTNRLKVRLCMALHPNTETGVRLADVWDTLHRAAPDLQQLAAKLGWPADELLAINSYRDCQNRYHFPSIERIRTQFSGFTLESVHTPTYALGERFPVITLRRQP